MNTDPTLQSRERAIIGTILGTAVGDAIGLPLEGLSKKRLSRLFPDLNGHRLLFGRGMCSDDTEHTCMVSQALIDSRGDVSDFTRSMSRKLRAWFLSIPAAAGPATVRACCKLLIGVPGHNSGVFSAGNGPAMRSAIIGVCFGHDPDTMKALVRSSTRITHTDPKAEHGAYAVALAAYMASTGITDSSEYINCLQERLGEDASEFLDLIASAVAAKADETCAFAEKLGLGKGVTGYVYHTVPVVLHAWFRHPSNYQKAILSVIACGGDTDTTAAILGGIVGSAVGEEGIPPDWVDGLIEWPHNVNWMRELGRKLASGSEAGHAEAPRASLLAVLVRNIAFLIIVLSHGFRRILPPY